MDCGFSDICFGLIFLFVARSHGTTMVTVSLGAVWPASLAAMTEIFDSLPPSAAGVGIGQRGEEHAGQYLFPEWICEGFHSIVWLMV